MITLAETFIAYFLHLAEQVLQPSFFVHPDFGKVWYSRSDDFLTDDILVVWEK